MVAEVSRKYRSQEEALHPTPSDHVPQILADFPEQFCNSTVKTVLNPE